MGCDKYMAGKDWERCRHAMLRLTEDNHIQRLYTLHTAVVVEEITTWTKRVTSVQQAAARSLDGNSRLMPSMFSYALNC